MSIALLAVIAACGRAATCAHCKEADRPRGERRAKKTRQGSEFKSTRDEREEIKLYARHTMINSMSD